MTHGYAKSTTGRIADLAQVSRGAQPLHFRTRADLLSAAVAHLAERRVAAVHERLVEGSPSIEDALDALWEEHQGVTFHATLELWVAARTDPELGAHLHAVEREVADAIARSAAETLGAIAGRPGFTDDLVFVLATIRGLALLQLSGAGAPGSLDRAWRHTRSRLVRLLS